MTTVWYSFRFVSGTFSKNGILEAMSRAGVRGEEFGARASQSVGLVFFDQVTTALHEFLREVSQSGLTRVLAISLSRTALENGHAWTMLQAGASDVFAWDHSMDPAAEIAARFERWEAVDALVGSRPIEVQPVGKSRVWTSVLRQTAAVARFTDASVLITGETGTGKELIARFIHGLDPKRRGQELVILDCTTVVPELAGSEFFGHERGAFTGAVTARDGAFALADGGTLFLDEVGDLSLTLQAELLRVVQERTYKRVGGNTWKRTDFRLICATNRNLQELEAAGRFRRDLYYRIAGWVFKLPPLRERADDILLLARHFIRQGSPHGPAPDLDDPVRTYLDSRDYPGNVRDLKQLIYRILYSHVGPGPITVGDVPETERPADAQVPADWRDASLESAIRRALGRGVGLREIGRATAEMTIRIALALEDGNVARAARRLGVTDRALQMRRATRRLRA
jgi:transcriptional regulator with GAF, ATPase, and Fis domain